MERDLSKGRACEQRDVHDQPSVRTERESKGDQQGDSPTPIHSTLANLSDIEINQEDVDPLPV